jgi:hypothetical protein
MVQASVLTFPQVKFQPGEDNEAPMVFSLRDLLGSSHIDSIFTYKSTQQNPSQKKARTKHTVMKNVEPTRSTNEKGINLTNQPSKELRSTFFPRLNSLTYSLLTRLVSSWDD